MSTYDGQQHELRYVKRVQGTGSFTLVERGGVVNFAPYGPGGFQPPIPAVIDEIWVGIGTINLIVRDNGGTVYVIDNGQLR